ncbi:Mariner Mos1 transposase [Eumeta japonica]|uniref:Mariner Mos1 transposase n=1 Tax=Eumeta variegata TaxID=151549 RepID=A0A4C1VW99_EUMVA|nr:Mariner Mos1 transposase [Eumeta japonica]
MYGVFLEGPKMSEYRRVLILAETHRLLVKVYNEAVLSEKTCREWFQKFKNGDFDVEGKDRSGRPKIYEDAELEELLDEIRLKHKRNLRLF